MKYPAFSFLMALLLFLMLVAIFFASPFFTQKHIIVPATVEIDAFMISEAVDTKVEKIAQKAVQKKIEEDPKMLEASDNTKQEVKKESLETKELQTIQKAQNSDPDAENKALILHGPLPKIPDHLRDEAFRSHAMARFYIKKDGSSRVELLKPSASPELNYLLLKNLAKWKFSTSEHTSIQDIRVNFMVQ